jgi:anti-sigma B factor antagonist
MVNLEITPLGDKPGLALAGELDLITAPALDEAVRDLPANGPVTLDLSQLTFIDSSGLRAIAEISRNLNGGGPLILANPSGLIRRVLTIVDFQSHPGIEIKAGE